jgi:hypothetical protein
MIECDKCGMKNDQDANFCKNCGVNLNDNKSQNCNECGYTMIGNPKFCSGCGKKN